MPASRSASPRPPKPAAPRWLLLIHQIPPKPDYLRVKVWRRLQRLGAVAIKNSVYALPAGDQTLEDFQWVAREIVADKGDAVICEAGLVEGLTDQQVTSLFQQARSGDQGGLHAVFLQRLGRLCQKLRQWEPESVHARLAPLVMYQRRPVGNSRGR